MTNSRVHVKVNENAPAGAVRVSGDHRGESAPGADRTAVVAACNATNGTNKPSPFRIIVEKQPMQLSTLNDLFVKELRDMYSAERQLVQTLPKMAKEATDPELADAFQHHLGETEQQVHRLEQAFELLDVGSRGPVCKGMKGIIDEGKELIEEDPEPDVLDAGMIAAAQRVEHYEIAAYGTLREYANVLGHTEIASLIEQSLEEEKAADQKLTALAEQGINAMATNGSEMTEKGAGGGPRSTQRRKR